MEIYRHDIQRHLEQYYGPLLTAFDRFDSIQDHLSAIANALHHGLQHKNKYLYYQLNNYNKKFIGRPVEELQKESFSLADARNTIAQEYGFKNWNQLNSMPVLSYQVDFQKAIDFLLEGNEAGLTESIRNNPNIIKTRSNYGHHASLLHYAGSNGVEMWRQKVPSNLVRLTEILLKNGANPDARMNVYGGQFTTYDMLTTSAHPKQAGILEEMKSLFS